MSTHGDGFSMFSEWLFASERRSDLTVYLGEFGEFFERSTGESYGEFLDLLSADAHDSLRTALVEDYLASLDDDAPIESFRDSVEPAPTPGQLSYLRALRKSTPSIYEVIESVPDSHLILRDLVRGGESVTVRERSASTTLVRWDLLIARVISVKRVTQITGGTTLLSRVWWPVLEAEMDRQWRATRRSIPADVRKDPSALAAARQELANSITWCALALWIFYAAQPRTRTLVNTDRDEIEFVSLAFPIIGSPSAISAALGAAPEFQATGVDSWNWLKDLRGESIVHAILTVEGDRLLAECNSGKRAKRFKERLVQLLGRKIGKPLKLRTSVQEAMKMPRDPQQSLIETLGPAQRDELQSKLNDLILQRYLRLLDDVVPMLGAPPRELVKSKDGRERVVNWLKLLETSYERGSKEANEPPFDLTPIWRELGILKLRT